jgi:hypothetical protein
MARRWQHFGARAAPVDAMARHKNNCAPMTSIGAQ